MDEMLTYMDTLENKKSKKAPYTTALTIGADGARLPSYIISNVKKVTNIHADNIQLAASKTCFMNQVKQVHLLL
jgi:hypothetical protein